MEQTGNPVSGDQRGQYEMLELRLIEVRRGGWGGWGGGGGQGGPGGDWGSINTLKKSCSRG